MAERGGLKADAVFEGGGVKGIGLVGALSIAEERGYRNWQNVAGASAGAIVAALVAAGYSAAELKTVLDGLEYREFKDKGPLDRIPFLGPLLSIILEKGVYEGRWFKHWMRARLREKNVTTFGDLAHPDFKDDPRYRYRLRVIASDVTRGRMLVLPQDIADFGGNPDKLDVAEAVRMSMSLPFFYEPAVRKDVRTGLKSYIVDGGMLSNFPVWLFDTDGSEPPWPTLGFKLVEPIELGGVKLSCPHGDAAFSTFERLGYHLEEAHGETGGVEMACPYPECEGRKLASPGSLEVHLSSEHVRHRIGGPASFARALLSTMLQAHDARRLDDADFVRTIAIPTLDVGTADFDLKREKSEELYQSGRGAAERFFEGWDFDSYVSRFRRGRATGGRGARLRAAGPD